MAPTRDVCLPDQAGSCDRVPGHCTTPMIAKRARVGPSCFAAGRAAYVIAGRAAQSCAGSAARAAGDAAMPRAVYSRTLAGQESATSARHT